MRHVTNTGGGQVAGGGDAADGDGRGRPRRTTKYARVKNASPAAAATTGQDTWDNGGVMTVGPGACRTNQTHDTAITLDLATAERLERMDGWRSAFLTTRRLIDRLQLLHDFGLTDHDLASIIPDAKARAVRRWRLSGPPSTRASEIWFAVDDLYYTVSYFLADRSFDEEAILAWLRSRQAELFAQRPLEALRAGEFDKVRAAAEAVVTGGTRAAPSDLVDPPNPQRVDQGPPLVRH